MSALTIRLPDKVGSELNAWAKKLHLSKSEYIRMSIERMNYNMQEQERKARLIKASKRVKEGSMAINVEFSEIEYDPKD